ncbi:MAG: hypothetical protein LBD30_02415 [Verrucomicrobiales bacterium]|jgi:hypothetical protein|nr:hypothetical protein [Verrucomicrobiales bacterium]
MEKLGEIIVPLIIFGIVAVNLIIKITKATGKSSSSPPTPPVRRPPTPPPLTPTMRNEWEDLLEALGKNQDADDELHPIELDERPPVLPPVSLPPATHAAIKPVTVSTPSPPTISPDEGGEKFVRVSDYTSRPLDQIDEREFAVQHDLNEKFTEKETRIPSAAAPTISGDHRTTQPIRARFRNRQSIRDAVIMSEILAAPLAMRS